MATYTTEEEIDAARDRSLAMPAQGDQDAENKLDKVNVQLSELKKQADTLATQKKALPPHLLEDVSGSRRKLPALEADLAQKKASADSIRAQVRGRQAAFPRTEGPGPQIVSRASSSVSR